jgi:hypothetical protein
MMPFWRAAFTAFDRMGSMIWVAMKALDGTETDAAGALI